MNYNEEATKTARDVKFGVVARALADVAAAGGDTKSLIAQLRTMRLAEQMSQPRFGRFAALARQIGDAARNGNKAHELELVHNLIQLRREEIGPARA